MRMILKRHFIGVMLLGALLILWEDVAAQPSRYQWDDPFASRNETVIPSSDSLTLQAVLDLVAEANPALKAGRSRVEAAKGSVKQAGLWPNPELEIELEEVGWDAPGLKEAEITAVLSQEIELWGARGNRKKVAQRELESAKWETALDAFEVYTAAVERYVALAYAQNQVDLARQVLQLAEAITKSVRLRVENGAAMPSELLLGELELEREKLELARFELELANTKDELASLWGGDGAHLVVSGVELDARSISGLGDLLPLADSSSAVVSMERDMEVVMAQLALERSAGKPNPIFNAGLKRIEGDASNTLVVGLAIPLPLFDRNQGSIRSLQSQTEAIKYDREKAVIGARTEFRSIERRIQQLVARYREIDTVLLYKAEETYRSLQEAYEKGRVPYTTLLEGQRVLVDFHFQLNELDLSIKQELVAIERLLGVRLLY